MTGVLSNSIRPLDIHKSINCPEISQAEVQTITWLSLDSRWRASSMAWSSIISGTNSQLFTAMTIDATVMNWVYISDSESRKHPLRNVVKTTTTGLFSSLSGFLTGYSTPQTHTSSLPTSTPQVDLTETSTTSIVLSVFSAEITVRLNSKLSSEIHRSTQKNPPSSMKYELIYVGWRLRTLFFTSNFTFS